MAKILWLADGPEWAYSAIVGHVSSELSQHKHKLAFCVPPDTPVIVAASRDADVIIAMYLRYVNYVPSDCRHKVVIMLTGMRPFEVVAAPYTRQLADDMTLPEG